jgi:DNA-binding MarR family transcriptional regulator
VTVPSATAKAEERRAAELDQLGKALRRVLANVRRLRGQQAHLGAQEISHAQFELLIELLERGRLPVGELAAVAQLTPSTVTGMLDHLVACGHVARSRAEQDRRVVVCELTAQGRREIEAHKAAKQAHWESALANIPSEDLRAATRVLTRVSSFFEEATTYGKDGVPENGSLSGRTGSRDARTAPPSLASP